MLCSLLFLIQLMGPSPTFSFSSAVQKYVMLHPLHDVGLCESTNVVDDLAENINFAIILAESEKIPNVFKVINKEFTGRSVYGGALNAAIWKQEA